MNTFSNRSLRRTLLAGGMSRRFLPKTRLAQFTAYIVGFALVFGALWRVLVWTGSAPAAISFAEWWWDALRNVALFFLFLLLVRWIRQRFMWSLRRRLFVTYFFIGVIPVALVALMAWVAAYLFAWQFASYLVVAQIRGELDTMATVNQVLASDSGKAKTAAALEQRARDLVASMPSQGAQSAVWLNGHPVAAQPQAPTVLPSWLDKSQRLVAVENGHMFARVVSLSDTPAGRLAVVSSIDLNPELTRRMAAAVGEIRVFIPDFEAATQNWDLETQRAGENGPQVTLQGEGEPAKEEKRRPRRGATIVAGTLPPPARIPDITIAFATPYEMVEWTTGKRASGLLAGRSRFSILYPELAAGLEGKWANFILGALVAIAIAFGVIELVAFFIGVGLSRTMTGSIANLYQATQHVKRADFSHRIEVRGNDQLAELQRSFNTMTEDIQRLILEQKEKERLQNELAIAQEVQDQLFPHDPKGLTALEVQGVCKPARTVSGDYYDFIPFGETKLGIAVGDISGKGISAALMMATVHSAMRAYERMGQAAFPVFTQAAAGRGGDTAARLAHYTQSPASALSLLNRHLYESTPLEKYATLFLGIYDETERSLLYSNAGHLPPYLIGADGAVRKLEAASGLMVGLFDHPTWEDASIDLHPGDLFVAFSDGVIEPENDFGEFGTARLLEIIEPLRAAPLARISEEVIRAVEDWIGAAEQPDDITLVLARAK